MAGSEEKVLYVRSCSQIPEPQETRGKGRHLPIKAHPTKGLTGPPPNCEGYQEQGKCEKLRPEQAEERWLLPWGFLGQNKDIT